MTLVTGGSGQLGTALRSVLRDAAYPPKEVLDLTAADTIEDIVADFSPDAIINCAAFTAVDRAETEAATAYAVNTKAVGVLASVAARRGIPFATVSTDYVFDGAARDPYVESSPTGPLNAYGRSKLAGEAIALEAHPGALVVRTSWVFSATHDNFVTAMLRRGSGARAVTDQRSSPTAADDLATALAAALNAGITGMLHLTNGGDTSRYELAVESFRLAGLDPDGVEAADSATIGGAPRPRYSAMRSERLDALGLEPLRPWQDALAPVVAAIIRRP